MKKNFIFLLFLIPLLFSQCTKDDNCCTCEVGYSESGSGTMGCLMDGVPWAACNFAHEEVKGSVSTFINDSDGFNYWQIINSKSYNGGDDVLFITIWYPKVGIIPKSSSGPHSTFGSIGAEFFTQNGKYSGIFKRDTMETFLLEVTKLDTINRIISGRFECALKEYDGGVDTTQIKITHGVFDTHY